MTLQTNHCYLDRNEMKMSNRATSLAITTDPVWLSVRVGANNKTLSRIYRQYPNHHCGTVINQAAVLKHSTSLLLIITASW